MTEREHPGYIKYIALDPKTSSDLCNELYPDKPEIVGSIFIDYVNFFLYDDDTLTEKDCDRCEHFARRQLAGDAVRLKAHAKEVSEKRAISGGKGGKSKSRKNKEQDPPPEVSYIPDEIAVIDYAHAKNYDGNITGQWLSKMIDVGWVDEKGLPIKNWRKRLDAYIKGFNRNKIEDMTKEMFK